MAVSGRAYLRSKIGIIRAIVLLFAISTFSLLIACDKSTAGRCFLLVAYLTSLCITALLYFMMVFDISSLCKWTTYYKVVDFWITFLLGILCFTANVCLWISLYNDARCNTQIPYSVFGLLTSCLYFTEIYFNYENVYGFTRIRTSSRVSRTSCRTRNGNRSYVNETGFQLATILYPDYENYLKNLDLCVEKNRLDTFRHWQRPIINIPELAQSGLFYLGNQNRTQCFSCSYEFSNWRQGENVYDKHQRFNPSCKMIEGIETTDVPLTFSKIQESSLLTKDPPYPDFSIVTELREVFPCLKPAYPAMRNILRRFSTFGQWPGWTFASPPQIGKAGFFFTGQKDRVRCWYCDGILENWDWYDEPWTKHAQWYPKCEFLLQTKGPEFVNRIAQAYPQTARLISNTMQSPVVLEIQQQGYDSITVERVVTSYLAAKKTDFTSKTALICAVENDLKESREHLKRNSIKEDIVIVDEEHLSSCSDNGDDRGSSLQTESQLNNVTEEGKCVVCLEAKSNIAFIPCGHVCCCNECAPRIRECPLCRKFIQKSMQVYMS